ncbi:hypothetical protein [Pontibacter rugosus]|uniref:Uncharacterized protein n=1 Tax=Pontibacter rugosus TaxID=1745966 RepID=A0ABW3SK92_9BACT
MAPCVGPEASIHLLLLLLWVSAFPGNFTSFYTCFILEAASLDGVTWDVLLMCSRMEKL